MELVITGATGYVGKHVLARLLGLGHRLSVIARPHDDGARARVHAALRPFAATLPREWGGRLNVIEGDIALPDCGITATALVELQAAEVDGFIHCAGLTRFEDRLENELFANNLGGTHNASALNDRLASPRFHHVSTAFVAGTATTSFGAEQLAVGQGFNNPYEASKFAAEEFLQRIAARGMRSTVIYRPSIVVGGNPIGAGNAVSTVYTFIKAMHFLRECYRRDTARGRDRFTRHGLYENAAGFHMPIRVAADPDTPLHLVSIDIVVEAIVDHLVIELPAAKTLQLTGQAYRLCSLRDAFCEVMRITGPTLVIPKAFDHEPRNAVEEHFFRITRAYQPYLLGAPQFTAPSIGASATIDLAALTSDFLDQMTSAKPARDGAAVGALAMDLQGIKRARDYFDKLTCSDVGRHFLGRHRFVEAAIRFRILGDDDFDEIIVFKDGRAQYALPHTARDYHCSYELDEALFLRVITGQTDLRNAFFAGKVSIQGDKEIALKFGSLLSHYYRNIEDNVIQEIAV